MSVSESFIVYCGKDILDPAKKLKHFLKELFVVLNTVPALKKGHAQEFEFLQRTFSIF